MQPEDAVHRSNFRRLDQLGPPIPRPCTVGAAGQSANADAGQHFPPGPRASVGAIRGHLTLRFSADDFPRLLTISYSTCWPSLSVLRPALSTAEIWTNTSCPPP